ncbi:adenylate/guanylate cyclase domain-containing protein (plasmid) [Legionella lytica]|uniref:Adenylate/guanylate cyclase domain-containing protein n=1 Tax=Legionella lytica TaxID=96232 RepID=A0ABY4YCN2_9GAMM|nr:adenylate/guanylate cyclase domain-containing protein [Legionella lytica]USQ15259.1 adenylate/guanylate cyclase domain-containing protein [Legionella lytica]
MAHNFKISIRISIMTLFLLLFGTIGFTIIGINYVAFNRILNDSAKDLITKTSLLVNERFKAYLAPLSHNIMEIRKALSNETINSNNPKLFARFLFDTIQDNPNIFMIHYGAKNGQFFNINREEKSGLQLIHTINSKPPFVNMGYQLDKYGKIIKTESMTLPYDPRMRPWYQEAVYNRKPIWTDIYKFYLFGKRPGIAVAAPIYDSNNNLQGVVAIALAINRLQKFIRELELTKNTMIFVINNKSNVIAFRAPHIAENILGKKLEPDLLKKLNIPSTIFSTPLHSKIQSYIYEGQTYFFSYQPIFNKLRIEPWHVLIITPENDVIEPLKNLSEGFILLTILILLIGAIFVRIISRKISNPIIQLAEESKQITMFNFKEKVPVKTMIKEISYLDKALSTLWSSLVSFQRYVPYSVVRKLVHTGKIAKVGGQNQTITLLFSDIKGFTTISESKSPQKIMTYLSDYFELMTKTIIQYKGTLDKYIGDGIMALWNAPEQDKDHAFNACETARIMLEQLKILNQKHDIEGFPEFNVKIGIHTGEAIVGNVGSEDRLNYTALGDAVNLASRLESINRYYNTQIIVSHATFIQVSEKFLFRFLDEVAVRGKQESIAIYELITAQDIERLEQHKQEFKEAFSLYQQGSWKQSMDAFMTLTPAYPGDKLASIYIERCQILEQESPANWCGVWRWEGV